MSQHHMLITFKPSADGRRMAYTVQTPDESTTDTVAIEGAMFLRIEEVVKNKLLRMCTKIHAQAKETKGK